MGKITCGKGTQATAILEHYGGTLFSVGNKVRENAKIDTTFGRKVKEMYEKGYLAPNWLASYWMMHALLYQYVDERVVFEAVARKPDEAEIFCDIHDWLDRKYIVFNLKIPDEIVLQRSRQRNRDLVDTETAVTTRLEEYSTYTLQSLEVFRSKNVLVDIDGTKSIDEVTQEIFGYLNT